MIALLKTTNFILNRLNNQMYREIILMFVKENQSFSYLI